VDNVLAAIAAAWWLKIDDSIIIRGLETFPAETELPARFQVSYEQGACVIRDQAKNGAALLHVIAALAGFEHERRRVVYTVPGDRRDEDIIRQGRLLGEAFDEVIIYDPAYRQQRPAGQVVELLKQGLATAQQADGRVKQIVVAEDAAAAETLALANLQPGVLVLLQQVAGRG